jgi:hypothetical protein
MACAATGQRKVRFGGSSVSRPAGCPPDSVAGQRPWLACFWLCYLGMPLDRRPFIKPIIVGRSPSGRRTPTGGWQASSQVPFGRTTQLFFKEGEEHEARQWEDVVLPPDDEPEPKRPRGSVYKIPRQRGAIVALAIFAMALVVGVAVGLRAFTRTGNVVENAVNAFKSLLPTSAPSWREPAPSVEPSRPAVVPPVPAVQAAPSSQLEGLSGPADQLRATLPATTMPADRADPAVSPSPAPTAPAADPAPAVPVPATVEPPPAAAVTGEGGRIGGRIGSTDEPAATAGAKPAKRSRPRRPRSNYVWSPEAKGLVPFRADEESGAWAPTTAEARHATPADELGPPPQIAPAPRVAPEPERAAPKSSDESE